MKESLTHCGIKNILFSHIGIVMAAGTIFAYFALRLERKKIRRNAIEICIDTKEETDTIIGHTI